MTLCWAAFPAVLGYMQPAGLGFDTPEEFVLERRMRRYNIGRTSQGKKGCFSSCQGAGHLWVKTDGRKG